MILLDSLLSYLKLPLVQGDFIVVDGGFRVLSGVSFTQSLVSDIALVVIFNSFLHHLLLFLEVLIE